MKTFTKKIIIILLFFILLFNIFNISYCFFDSTPKIVTKLNDAFTKIEEWLLKLATPAAAVAVGTGVFMKKFSFGDEERIRIAKKLIRNSLFSYGFILAIDLILSAIKTLIV
ncbi:MAG: pilin [Clostridia bacterium]|nr:pilin [Clostridia bacterium]